MVTYTKAEAIQNNINLHDTENSICDFHTDYPDQNAIMNTCEECVYIFDDGCMHGSDDFCKECDPEGTFITQCPQCNTVDYTLTCQYCNENRRLG